MVGLILVIVFGLLVVFYRSDKKPQIISSEVSNRLDQLLDIAKNATAEQKYLRAEKALLTVLKFDERNASAYNRLGILYAKQQQYDDAIECFEIAQSLEPNAISLHNVGLIYYETMNYEKSAIAFKQALEIDDSSPVRHVAYAKVLEKMGNLQDAISELTKAISIELKMCKEPSQIYLKSLAEDYEKNGQNDLAEKVKNKLIKINTTNKNQLETRRIN